MDKSSPRFFPGQRWVNIGLRSLHLLGVAGMGGGLLLARSDVSHYYPYLLLTLIDSWSDRLWPYQLSGQSLLLKLLLLALIPLWPRAAPLLFAAVILLSALVSHAPARIRHYSLLHRRSMRPPRGPRPPGAV